MNLILIGFMGSGKTTISKRLGKDLKIKTLDTDTLIEQKMHLPIKEIFKRFGEPFFRRLEKRILKKVIEQNSGELILSTGGGLPCYKNNYEILKSFGLIVYLKMPKCRLFTITSSNRPLLKKKSVFFYNKRQKCYNKAKFKVDNVDIGKTIEHIKNLMR